MTFILFFFPILLVVYFGFSSRQFSLAKTQESMENGNPREYSMNGYKFVKAFALALPIQEYLHVFFFSRMQFQYQMDINT